MANSRDRSITLNKNDNDQRHLIGALRDGYRDAHEGKGFRKQYETAMDWYQKNYERGRLLVVGLRGMGVAPPVWRETVLFPNKLKAIHWGDLENHKGLPLIPYND